jgi:serine/threonine protein kinase
LEIAMPTSPAACPSEDALVAYGLGKLAAAAADTVNAHLSTCDGCVRKLVALSADSFVGHLRAAGPPTAAVPPTAAGPPTAAVPPGRDQPGLSRSIPDPAPIAVGELPPELVNHPQYTDVRELGRGGMGVVYLAFHRLMQRQVVLKVVGRPYLSRPGAKDRFLREVQSAARLQHPNVVTAYTVDEVGESLVFAMEYVPGDDLAKVVKAAGPLAVTAACHYVAQVALGLQHAHDQGMVHRDIKPANLILTRDGRKAVVKVLDFGLAKVTSEQAQNTGLTQQGVMMGTPDYMAPEQATDAAKADSRADIYSLGCTLYYLLAGHPPFKGVSLTDVLLKHQTETARALNLVRPEVPAEVAAVVAKMMAKDPARRYQTPAEVAAALKPFLATRPLTKPATDVSKAAKDTVRPSATAARPVASPLAAKPAKAKADPPAKPAKEPRPAAPADEGLAGSKPAEPKAPAPRLRASRPWWVWPAVAAGVVAVGLLAGWAGGVFGASGTVELTDVPTDADVFVDGSKATVTWDAGKKTGEVRVKAGPHTLEVKRGGATEFSERVEVAGGGRAGVRGFVPLFNGTDTTGWKDLLRNGSTWRVEGGVLVGKGGPVGQGRDNDGVLESVRNDFDNFHLRVEVQNADEANKMIDVRSSYSYRNDTPGVETGYRTAVGGKQRNSSWKRGEFQRIGVSGPDGPGGPSNFEAVVPPEFDAGDEMDVWHVIEVIANGGAIEVRCDGKRVLSYQDKSPLPPGRIGFWCPEGEKAVRIKRIEIRELTGTAKFNFNPGEVWTGKKTWTRVGAAHPPGTKHDYMLFIKACDGKEFTGLVTCQWGKDPIPVKGAVLGTAVVWSGDGVPHETYECTEAGGGLIGNSGTGVLQLAPKK